MSVTILSHRSMHYVYIQKEIKVSSDEKERLRLEDRKSNNFDRNLKKITLSQTAIKLNRSNIKKTFWPVTSIFSVQYDFHENIETYSES